MKRGSIHRRVLVGVAACAALVVGWLLLRPAPLLVEAAAAVRGPMRVTVDEDGETRAHDRFVVAAPIPGRLLRVELEEGDSVHENQIVARIEPLPLNQQQRQEVLARIEAAEAVKRQADARLAHAREDYEQARRDRDRMERLAHENVTSAQALEQARNAEITGGQELEAAKFSALAAGSDVKLARAGLVGIESSGVQKKIVSLRSPVAGRVLRIVEKSERVLLGGAPVIVVGDPGKIEVITDVLTTDAVNIKPGAAVFLEAWGGAHALRARVRLVEPAGFTKISALGVEEQRVNVVSDFVDAPEGLGDGYRVEARIVTWEASDVLKIPGSAPYRMGDSWSVYVVEGGRVRQRPVQVGHRNSNEVEILSGLGAGDVVVLHPSNQLREGSRVKVI